MPTVPDSRVNIRKKLSEATEIATRGVCKSFGHSGNGSAEGVRVILDEVDFEFRAGSIIGLIGRTGVGKTTLGRIMSGILRPDHGTVSIGGVDLFDLNSDETREVRQWLRYVPQNPDAVLPTNITVDEALREASINTRLVRDEQMKWRDMIQTPVMYDPTWATRQIGDLSLGQRRRVVNLRSLQACPKFIILDEPFNGLDLEFKHGMLDLLRKVSTSKDIGIMFISHDVEALDTICDTIWLLENGVLEEYVS